MADEPDGPDVEHAVAPLEELYVGIAKIKSWTLWLTLLIPVITLVAILVTLVMMWQTDVDGAAAIEIVAVFLGFWAITMTRVVAPLAIIPNPSMLRDQHQASIGDANWQSRMLIVLQEIHDRL